MGRNGHGPIWLWAEMTRNPNHDMSEKFVNITLPAGFTLGFMNKDKIVLVLPRSTHPIATPTPIPTASDVFMAKCIYRRESF